MQHHHRSPEDWLHSKPEEADKFIWSVLLSDKVITAPQIAFDLIQHY